MSCTSMPSKTITIQVFLAALAVAIVMGLFWNGSVHALDNRPSNLESNPPSLPLQQEAEDSAPDANLSYMFAVFIITWAVLFGYLFVMSRRQRDLQHELKTLRTALSEKKCHSERHDDH